jgi:hypothetical protein
VQADTVFVNEVNLLTNKNKEVIFVLGVKLILKDVNVFDGIN